MSFNFTELYYFALLIYSCIVNTNQPTRLYIYLPHISTYIHDNFDNKGF